MNKQEHLISADKLLEWLSGNMSNTGSDDRYFAYESVQEAVESGEFKPDTIPLPTLKPGDEVRHKSGGAGYGIGTVTRLSKSGERAAVKPWGAYYRLDKLELVEDEDDEEQV